MQAPLQPVKVEPGLAAAVSATIPPPGYAAVHVPPQSIPAGVLVTVPRPVPVLSTSSTLPTVKLPNMESGCTSHWKWYEPCVTVIVQVGASSAEIPVVSETPGPLRWKLWFGVVSCTSIVYVPGARCVTVTPSCVSEMTPGSETVATSCAWATPGAASATAQTAERNERRTTAPFYAARVPMDSRRNVRDGA